MTPQQLRELRLSRGITAAHVAKQLNIGKPYLHDMEKGGRPMSEARAKAYLSAIGGEVKP